MTPQRHRAPVLSARGNWDERAAQITHIKERLDRLRRFAEPVFEFGKNMVRTTVTIFETRPGGDLAYRDDEAGTRRAREPLNGLVTGGRKIGAKTEET